MVWIESGKVAFNMIWLWTFVNITKGQRSLQNIGHPEYKIQPTESNLQVQIAQTMEKQTMKVTWINSTTSSIAINWTFIGDYQPNGTFFGSQIEYFVKDGRFTSDVFPSHVNEYILENLKPATMYTICVNMIESDPSVTTHLESKYHSECIKIATIPYVRKDSVLVLLLTLGYFCFMGSLGYSQWRRKLIYIRNKYRREDVNLSDTTPTSRWIDLQERVKLNNECSIEDAVRL